MACRRHHSSRHSNDTSYSRRFNRSYNCSYNRTASHSRSNSRMNSRRRNLTHRRIARCVSSSRLGLGRCEWILPALAPAQLLLSLTLRQVQSHARPRP